MLSNYKTYSEGDYHVKTSFEITDIHLSLANSLRRCFSSIVPTVTFDDEYKEQVELKSIVINKNTSALHNEFLSHRLSLIPINLNNNELKIKTAYNPVTFTRDISFYYPDKVPIFSLKVQNNLQHKRDKDGFIEVTSNDFTLENGDSADKFFILDPYTKDAIIINKLKSNLSNDDEGEELDIICKPTLGDGRKNARYDPTGTVTFQFKVDESRTEETFKKKLEYMNNERIQKNLDIYTEEETKQIYNSFQLLDKERVFFINSKGEPNIFQYSVETIGFYKPDEIIVNGMKMLFLILKDIINSINFKTTTNNIEIVTNDKLLISDTVGQQNGISILIKKENHTIGNLLSNYLRLMFLDNEPLLKYASYRMPHPLVEEIEIILIPHVEDKEVYIKYIKNCIDDNPDFSNFNMSALNNMSESSIKQILCSIMLIKAINTITLDIKDLCYQFSKNSKVYEPTYVIEDTDEFFNKYSKLWSSFTNKYKKPTFRIGTAEEAISTYKTVKLE